MAKNWFPIIDEHKCIQCGACINKCLNEVYDKTAIPLALVIKPLIIVMVATGVVNCVLQVQLLILATRVVGFLLKDKNEIF